MVDGDQGWRRHETRSLGIVYSDVESEQTSMGTTDGGRMYVMEDWVYRSKVPWVQVGV